MKNINLNITNLLAAKINVRRQQGAALIMALVILLVMSVIAISNIQSSTLQERMAGNTRQKTVSLYAAESALKVAEKWIETTITGSANMVKFNGANGLYSAVGVAPSVPYAPSSADIADLGRASAWGDITAYTEQANIIAGDIVSRQPQYIIEYVGRDYRGTANKVIGTDDLSKASESQFSKPYFFRITAIGWGKDKRIYTVLESTYKTGSSEFFNY